MADTQSYVLKISAADSTYELDITRPTIKEGLWFRNTVDDRLQWGDLLGNLNLLNRTDVIVAVLAIARARALRSTLDEAYDDVQGFDLLSVTVELPEVGDDTDPSEEAADAEEPAPAPKPKRPRSGTQTS